MKLPRMTRKQKTGLLFASPAIIYIALFFLYPFFYDIYLGFTEYSLISPPEFAGLDNYARMFSRDLTFGTSVYATLTFSVGYCLGIWILAPAFSLFFNNKFKGKSIYVTLFLITAMIGIVPTCVAWKTLLHPTLGAFNNLFFYSWGYPGKLEWFASISQAMPGVILVTLVAGIPFYSIYLIGALGGIPQHYYEVAKLGGANLFQRLRYVVLPSIKPIYLFVVVTSLIAGFQMFAPFYILTNGGPLDVTRVLPLYIYTVAFRYYEFGYASAMTMILLAITGILCYLSIKIMSR